MQRRPSLKAGLGYDEFVLSISTFITGMVHKTSFARLNAGAEDGVCFTSRLKQFLRRAKSVGRSSDGKTAFSVTKISEVRAMAKLSSSYANKMRGQGEEEQAGGELVGSANGDWSGELPSHTSALAASRFRNFH